MRQAWRRRLANVEPLDAAGLWLSVDSLDSLRLQNTDYTTLWNFNQICFELFFHSLLAVYRTVFHIGGITSPDVMVWRSGITMESHG